MPEKCIGVFKITPIQGVDYCTNTLCGKTNEKGEFEYLPGETVTFSIGKLILGTATAKELMTPADLSMETAGDIKKITNRKVTNIARFLLSLNPKEQIEDGIVITEEVEKICSAYAKTLYFNQPEDFFTEDGVTQSLMQELGQKLVSPAYARNYLRRAMNGIVKQTDVKVPMRDGAYVLADIYRPAKEGKYPVVISYGGYGKAFWYGKEVTEEDFELHQQMEDNYFQGIPKETDFINFATGQAGIPAVPDGTPGFPKHGSRINPMVSHVSEHFERANSLDWVPYGYVVMLVDSRGLGRVPGRYSQFGYEEALDYYDAIEWAGKQSWSNGNVGTYGASFYGMNAFNVSTLNPPSLKAMIALAADLDPYRDYMRNGGLANKFVFTPNIREDEFEGPNALEYAMTHPFDEGYEATSQSFMKGDYKDIKVPFWTAIPLESSFLHTRGTSEIFINAGTPAENKKMDICAETGVHFWMYNDDVIKKHRAFFDHWLKGEDNTVMEDEPAVHIMIRTGYSSYFWKDSDTWPVEGTKYQKLYLNAVTEDMKDMQELTELPAEAVKSVSYGADMNLGKFPFEQGAVRFQTKPFEEDTVLAGYFKLNLFVSSSSDDMAYIANVHVLDEDGQRVPLVLDMDTTEPLTKGAMKVSHRKLDPERSTEYRPFHTHTREDYQPLQPGEIVEVETELNPSAVQVKAGWSLELEILPNSGSALLEPEDSYMHGAVNTIYTGKEFPSYLQIPVI